MEMGKGIRESTMVLSAEQDGVEIAWRHDTRIWTHTPLVELEDEIDAVVGGRWRLRPGATQFVPAKGGSIKKGLTIQFPSRSDRDRLVTWWQQRLARGQR
ncbi:MAG: hypothetical protein VR70_11020 [Rhodospirillaceae bacterium BRH_c57]|nr:MAG: hypothetical protein VR70_11020 [Rhodospirillaceae bacterium BRH_c57]